MVLAWSKARAHLSVLALGMGSRLVRGFSQNVWVTLDTGFSLMAEARAFSGVLAENWAAHQFRDSRVCHGSPVKRLALRLGVLARIMARARTGVLVNSKARA